MKNKERTLSVDTVFVMVLFCIFAATILFVLMSGANVYKNNAKIMQERYEQRTCLSYISAKVKHFDSKNSVYITDFNGVDALAMEEDINGRTYTTLIYFHNGKVKELFAQKGQVFNLSSGSDIISVKDLQFKRIEGKPNLIEVICTGNDNVTARMTIGVRSENGGAAQ